jgi:hypothetical protein
MMRFLSQKGRLSEGWLRMDLAMKPLSLGPKGPALKLFGIISLLLQYLQTIWN